MSDDLNVHGFMRLPQIIGPHGLLPISRSSWWYGVKKGIYPSPIKIAPRTTVWARRSILALVDRLERGEA